MKSASILDIIISACTSIFQSSSYKKRKEKKWNNSRYSIVILLSIIIDIGYSYSSGYCMYIPANINRCWSVGICSTSSISSLTCSIVAVAATQIEMVFPVRVLIHMLIKPLSGVGTIRSGIFTRERAFSRFCLKGK